MENDRSARLNAFVTITAIFLPLFTLGCTPCTEETCLDHGLWIDLVAPAGTSYAVYLADGGTVVQAVCGDPPHEAGLECSDRGARWNLAPDQLEVTVVARGLWTHSARHRPLYAEHATACAPCAPLLRHGTVELALEKLPPFVDTADYATGLEHEGGLERFLELAEALPTEFGPSHVLKFYIGELQSRPIVYFQNTHIHRFHYDFVRNVLGRPLSLAEYEAETYRGADRTGFAGSIVYYPGLAPVSASAGGPVRGPFTINFFPSDDLSPDQVSQAYLLLQEHMLFLELEGAELRLFYTPAGSDQENELEGARVQLAGRGVLWLQRQEIYRDLRQQLLNPGIAYGTLRLLTPAELEQSPVSFQDILILTRLPNELPLVGGTITEEPQTPLAHVNVAARSRGTPNLALLEASTDPRIAPLLGEMVRFEVTAGSYSLAPTTRAEAEAFWSARLDQVMQVPDADLSVNTLVPLAELHFADSSAVGAKAANVAELAHLLGSGAPDGFAIPFHFYQRFMTDHRASAALCEEARADCVDEGRAPDLCRRAARLCYSAKTGDLSLAQLIDRWLMRTDFIGDSGLREAALDSLRYLIHHLPVDADLASDLDATVGSFFGDTPIRMRSSTNAEDLPDFSGAGLYRSVTANDGRLASDRVRRVWASVWSWRAFEERSFWNIDHRAMQMGVLVHQAFPEEAANGVLITRNIADPLTPGMYVNVQLGEVSVTNPEQGALPEVFTIIAAPEGLQVARQRFSSLSSASPILSEAEVADLYQTAYVIQHHFAPLYQVDPQLLVLEIEFKLHGSERQLIVKQARPFNM